MESSTSTDLMLDSSLPIGQPSSSTPTSPTLALLDKLLNEIYPPKPENIKQSNDIKRQESADHFEGQPFDEFANEPPASAPPESPNRSCCLSRASSTTTSSCPESS